jgi:hypothetical protein
MRKTDIEKVSRNIIAHVLGVKPPTISSWVSAEGCPRNPDKTYNIRTVVSWYSDRIEDSVRKKQSGLPQNVSEEGGEWLDKYRKEKALIARLDRLEREKELMPIEDVHLEWATRVSVVTHGLELLIDRLPPLIEGKTRIDIAKILKQEVYDFRKSFVKHGRYCPKN